MITTLTGENSLALQTALHELVTSFVAEHGDLALERVDGEAVEFNRLSEALTSLPFLSSKKLVVLRRPSTNKSFVDQAEQLLAAVPETTDVILVEPKLDKRLNYYKFLKKETDYREFPELDVTALAIWLVAAAKAQQGSLSSSDARYLIERVGTNQQLVANELDKLLLYDSSISRRTIDLLTEPAPQSSVFELLEAAFRGDSRRTAALYAEQRAQKVEAPQIIALLAWQLHVLAVIKTAGQRGADDIAREAKLNPFVVRKSQAIARSLSLAELKALIANLRDIDAQSKRTNLDLDEALQHYLLSLSSA